MGDQSGLTSWMRGVCLGFLQSTKCSYRQLHLRC